MAASKICSAGSAKRFACPSDCNQCNFLIEDRREVEVDTYLPHFSNRRRLNTWIPYSYRFAGDGIPAGPAGTASEPVSALPLVLMTGLILFNLLDALLTRRALSMGIPEGNPLMAGLLNSSMPAALALKSVFVGAGAFILWWHRSVPLAVRGMAVATGCYGLVVAYHLFFQLSM